jgi:hypothetical protein
MVHIHWRTHLLRCRYWFCTQSVAWLRSGMRIPIYGKGTLWLGKYTSPWSTILKLYSKTHLTNDTSLAEHWSESLSYLAATSKSARSQWDIVLFIDIISKPGGQISRHGSLFIHKGQHKIYLNHVGDIWASYHDSQKCSVWKSLGILSFLKASVWIFGGIWKMVCQECIGI